MSARVSVRLDGPDGDAVAVKTATTPEELGRLTYEATQLRRASHPGVVSLVGQVVTGDGAELHTRFAGQPLDRWRGNLPRLAGLGAAVAATLADLHELGIVHGRLDGSHILLGADGRPRLCGFSPAGDAEAPDDVAALGRLLGTLADQIPLSDRRGLLAWRRGPLAERRAFDHLVSHATDPVATRRPSARAFATALLAAVTDAELPPAGDLPTIPDPTGALPTPLPANGASKAPSSGERRGARADAGARRDPRPIRVPRVEQLRLGLPSPATVRRGDTPAGAGRTTDQPGTPGTQGTSPHTDRQQHGAAGDEGALADRTDAHHPTRSRRSPEGERDTGTWPGLPAERPRRDDGDDGQDGTGDGPQPDARTRHRARPAMNGGRHDGAHDPWDAGGGLPVTDAADDGRSPTSGSPSHGGGAGDGTGERPGREGVVREAQGDGVLHGDDLDDDLGDPDWSGYDDVFGDQTQVGLDDVFIDRPWPGFREPTAQLRRPRRHRTDDRGHRLMSRAAVLVVGAVAFTALLLWLDLPQEGDTTTEDPLAAPDSSEAPTTDPCRAPGGAAGPDQTGLAAAGRADGAVGADDEGGGSGGSGSAAGTRPEAQADVDGDGCPEPVHIEAGVVEVAGERWAVGHPDDAVTFGDWDCDGVATPAVYRPTTGDVFVFPDWARPGETLTVEPVAQVAGGRSLSAAPAGTADGDCDTPVVELADGALHTVEVVR